MFLSPVYIFAAPITNFGGVISYAMPCPCSANWVLFILDKRGAILPLIYQPGVSLLYMMYQPRPVVNTLGSFVPGGVCSTGKKCIPYPTLGTIFQMGTSMTIAP
jgi:hypothetical protein